MARKPFKREPSSLRSAQIIRIEKAESMVVFDEQSPVWKTKKLGGRATFVTLKPPPDASDSLIDEIKTQLYALGARVVNVHAKQKALTVIEQEKRSASTDVRKVVMTMVEEANTKDRDALRVRVEHSLAAVGL